MAFDPGLQEKQVITNNELTELFKCGNMGGMRRSHTTNTLVIVSDYTKGLYHDKWHSDILHYTGMGKNGDQDINFNQNRTLNESQTNGVTVVLFEVFKAKEYTFIGEIELSGTPYQEDQPGEDGVMRKVWVFPVKIKKGPQTDTLAKEVEDEIASIEETGDIGETEKITIIKSRIGHGALKKELLEKEGKCALCGLSDERFLIASHIKPWSKSTNKERLDINNVLLLCPHHDAVFDKGYVSFNEESKLIISNELDLETRALLNLVDGKKINLSDARKKYIEWHRGNIFK